MALYKIGARTSVEATGDTAASNVEAPEKGAAHRIVRFVAASVDYLFEPTRVALDDLPTPPRRAYHNRGCAGAQRAVEGGRQFIGIGLPATVARKEDVSQSGF
jgi:hypothetical protein